MADVIIASVVFIFLMYGAWELRTYIGPGQLIIRAMAWIGFVGGVGIIVFAGVSLALRLAR